MLVGNNKLPTPTNAGEFLAVSIAMRMRQYAVFTRSLWLWLWMSPSSKCSHRIAAAAAMVNDGRKHKTLTKNYF
jgi:hypothetical protein